MDITKMKDIIQGLKSIIDTEINLLDESGCIVYSTDLTKIDGYDDLIQSLNLGNKFLIEEGDYLYCYCLDYNETKYLLSIKGIDDETKRVAKIIEILLHNNVVKKSKEDFIRSLLLAPVEDQGLEDSCQKHHISINEEVQVVVIESIEGLIEKVAEIVKALLPGEIAVKVSNNYFAIVKKTTEEANDFPALLYDTILSELLYEVKIGVGPVVKDIKDWHFSYGTAESLIVIGKTFLPSKKIYGLKNLTIPFIVTKLQPGVLEELMKQFSCDLEDIFLNNELMTTISVFFKNNLNISDTAKNLFIHRNTLIYRLNKIYEITGYDLRLFEDAMLFNILFNGCICLRENHHLIK